MANKYRELKTKLEEKINSLPIKYAFSREQLDQLLKEWGVDVTQIESMGYGAFIKTADKEMVKKAFDDIDAERKAAIAADETGMGFIYDMFLYELRNHEYAYTGDSEDTVDSLGLTYKEIEADARLKKGFEAACRKAIKEDCF